MAKKHTIDFIRQRFSEEDYTLLSTEYKGSARNLDYICPVGHKDSGTWSNWQQGRRCYYCGRDRIKKFLTLDFGGIKKSFGDEHYILLSTIYKGASEKLNFICPNGHKNSISWNSWDRGSRCISCSREKNAKAQRLDINYVRRHFEKENYILLDDEYRGAQVKLNYICSEGHHGAIRWNGWQQGKRCSICSSIKQGIRISGHNHPQWEGGIARKPYCSDWTKEYKNYIKERDGDRCLNPNCSNKFSDLHVHHIDYNKENCDQFNLITLCISCNSRANSHREWHKSWYQAVMYRRYNK